MTTSERLGALDASFLELEDANDAARTRLFNLTITNVPGPRRPLYVLRDGIGQSLAELRSLARRSSRAAAAAAR